MWNCRQHKGISAPLCYFVIILITLFYFNSGFAQGWEMGISGGVSNYQGDLAPDVNLSENHPYFNYFLKKNLNPYFAVGLNASQAHISGKDANFSYLVKRNLDFETNIFEVATILEFNFFPYDFGLHPMRFTPYVFTGICVFGFEPYTNYQSTKTKLNQYDTEGRVAGGDWKHNYSLLQFSIPIGGGLKYKLSSRFNVGINLSYRYCFTDYLDDVSTVYFDKDILIQEYGQISYDLSDKSPDKIGKAGKQRGRSDLKDYYIFAGIFLSYKIKDSVCFKF